jgi:uncharacterized protein
MANNDTFDLQRRRLMKLGAGAGAAVAFTSPFEALAHGGRKSGPGYGDLVEAIDETTGLPLLKLPRGFRYLSFGWTGDPLEDGQPTPGGHDGGAVLEGAYGRVYYVRNHELSYSAGGATRPFAAAKLTYDHGGAPGGTTTVLFDERRGEYIRSWASLSGTIRNCAGGATPWGSWLTCEENLDDPISPTAAGLQQTHGWVFDVPAKRRARPVPIKGMGRFNHEAVAVDPATGVVYESEDTSRSGFYRYVPKCWGQLHEGGKLEMLRVKGQPQLATGKNIPVGTTFDVDWVPIVDPERRDADPGKRDGQGVFSQGYQLGGASFVRGEGMWYGNGRIYFISTSGGNAGKGQVWELHPRRDRLKLIYESPAGDVLDSPDNITVSPRGGLLLCEDGRADPQRMKGLTTDGEIFDFAHNNVVLDGQRNGISGSFTDNEWAGASFTPSGDWLIASIQTPGITFAITGPWRKGAL